MASNPPSTCCLKVTFHKGDVQGQIAEPFGTKSYVSGTPGSDKVLIIFTDIYGYKLKNVQLIADKFAKEGYYVIIPDLFSGEGPPEHVYETIVKFVTKHVGPALVLADKLIKDVHEAYPKAAIHTVGHCFGAKMVIKNLTKDSLVKSGAVAHPSLVDIEEVAAIAKPLSISAAEIDPAFTTELRHQSEAKLTEIGATFQLNLFSKVEHGFAVKGDMEVPTIRKAAEKVILDQLYWFDNY